MAIEQGDETVLLGDTKPNVSVLICVVAHISDERQRILFERTIESILALDTTKDVFVSVLVLDNASLYPVQDILAQKASSLIQIVRRDVNSIGAARSQAVAMASAQNHEWIAFIDADIEVSPQWLMIQIRELQSTPMRDAVGIGTVNRPPHEGDFSRALDFFLRFEHVHLGSTQVIQIPASIHQSITKMKVGHIPTCAAVFHTKALYQAGSFDPGFSLVGEDLEMSYRLKRQGSLWLLSQPVAFHRQDRNWQGWAKRMFRYGWGQIEVSRRHPQHLQTRKVIPLIAALAVVLAVFVSLFGYSAPMKLLVVVYLAIVAAPIILRGISESKMETAFHACWIALVTHAAYSAGMWAGLFGLFKNPSFIQSGDEI